MIKKFDQILIIVPSVSCSKRFEKVCTEMARQFPQNYCPPQFQLPNAMYRPTQSMQGLPLLPPTAQYPVPLPQNPGRFYQPDTMAQPFVPRCNYQPTYVHHLSKIMAEVEQDVMYKKLKGFITTDIESYLTHWKSLRHHFGRTPPTTRAWSYKPPNSHEPILHEGAAHPVTNIMEGKGSGRRLYILNREFVFGVITGMMKKLKFECVNFPFTTTQGKKAQGPENYWRHPNSNYFTMVFYSTTVAVVDLISNTVVTVYSGSTEQVAAILYHIVESHASKVKAMLPVNRDAYLMGLKSFCGVPTINTPQQNALVPPQKPSPSAPVIGKDTSRFSPPKAAPAKKEVSPLLDQDSEDNTLSNDSVTDGVLNDLTFLMKSAQNGTVPDPSILHHLTMGLSTLLDLTIDQGRRMHDLLQSSHDDEVDAQMDDVCEAIQKLEAERARNHKPPHQKSKSMTAKSQPKTLPKPPSSQPISLPTPEELRAKHSEAVQDVFDTMAYARELDRRGDPNNELVVPLDQVEEECHSMLGTMSETNDRQMTQAQQRENDFEHAFAKQVQYIEAHQVASWADDSDNTPTSFDWITPQWDYSPRPAPSTHSSFTNTGNQLISTYRKK